MHILCLLYIQIFHLQLYWEHLPHIVKYSLKKLFNIKNNILLFQYATIYVVIYGSVGCFQSFAAENYAVINIFELKNLVKSLIIFSRRISRNRIPRTKDIEFLRTLFFFFLIYVYLFIV